MGVTVSHWDKEKGTTHRTVEHVGYVVGTGSQYLGDGDSHYWAVVFNPETSEFEHVGLGYTPYDAKVDAPAEMREAYENLQEAKRALARAEAAVSNLGKYERDAAWDAESVTRGKWVKVVKGRKVPKGTVGLVKVHHEGQWGWSVLLETLAGEEVWTSESNVEVLPVHTVEAQAVTV